MNTFQRKIYDNFASVRDHYFQGIARVLTFFHIKANYITLAGVVLMIFFVIFVKINLIFSLLFLIISYLCDSFDGVLARYQKVQSDRGKLVDVVSDNFNTYLFILGVALSQTIHPLILISYTYLMLLSKVFRIFINSFGQKSDWIFKPVAGFIPTSITQVGYIIFGVTILIQSYQILDYFLLISSAVLLVDSIYYFKQILDLQVNK